MTPCMPRVTLGGLTQNCSFLGSINIFEVRGSPMPTSFAK